MSPATSKLVVDGRGKPIHVARRTDHQGRRYVIVPVHGAREYTAKVNPLALPYAVVDEDAFDWLCDVGLFRAWILNCSNASKPQWSYVRTTIPGSGLRSVAQLIAQAPSGSGISYRDGNPLNLRRENLEIRGGRSKGDCIRAVDQNGRKALNPAKAARLTLQLETPHDFVADI